MKRSFVIALLIITASVGLAQDASVQPGYLRFPNIPPFTLLDIDSSTLSREDLAKNKKTLIVYFRPDCHHCREETDIMLANIDKFKEVQILMATNEPFSQMTAFYKEYRLGRFPNIRMGRDTKFFFPPFYKMATLPYMILYNKKGRLITTFEGPTPIRKVVEAFAVDN